MITITVTAMRRWKGRASENYTQAARQRRVAQIDPRSTTFPPAFAPYLAGVLMGTFMSFIMSGVVTAVNTGLADGFIGRWMSACLVAWALVVPLAIIGSMVIPRIMKRLIKMGSWAIPELAL